MRSFCRKISARRTRRVVARGGGGERGADDVCGVVALDLAVLPGAVCHRGHRWGGDGGVESWRAPRRRCRWRRRRASCSQGAPGIAKRQRGRRPALTRPLNSLNHQLSSSASGCGSGWLRDNGRLRERRVRGPARARGARCGGGAVTALAAGEAASTRCTYPANAAFPVAYQGGYPQVNPGKQEGRKMAEQSRGVSANEAARADKPQQGQMMPPQMQMVPQQVPEMPQQAQYQRLPNGALVNVRPPGPDAGTAPLQMPNGALVNVRPPTTGTSPALVRAMPAQMPPANGVPAASPYPNAVPPQSVPGASSPAVGDALLQGAVPAQVVPVPRLRRLGQTARPLASSHYSPPSRPYSPSPHDPSHGPGGRRRACARAYFQGRHTRCRE